jgi:hypothetical protein
MTAKMVLSGTSTPIGQKSVRMTKARRNWLSRYDNYVLFILILLLCIVALMKNIILELNESLTKALIYLPVDEIHSGSWRIWMHLIQEV